MKLNVGIDLGGTKMLVVVLDPDMKVLSRRKTKVKKGVSPLDTAIAMKNLCEEALSKCSSKWSDVGNIGLSIPSSVNPETGEAFHAPALGWKNVPIKSIISEVFGRDTVIENDVNCGVLAECAVGSARNFKNVIGYFVGTGLGGGIIIDGKLFKGTRGLAGELGHEKIVCEGRKCGCGKRGCVEAYCSKAAFARRLEKVAESKKVSVQLKKYFGNDFSSLKSSQLREAWDDGNKVVREIIIEGFSMLGLASANLVAIMDPECIVYGGGVVEALGDAVMKPIRDAFEENLFGIKASDVYLCLSALGDDAVPMGAAINAIGRLAET